MVDVWRLKHPTDRQYTFFSHVHNSYSRIDFFLVDFKVASRVTSVKHHNRIISDHSAVTISLDLFDIKPNYSWRFNPTLLLDSHFSQCVTEWLDDYLMFNDTGEVSDSTLWESLKAVLRGHIISYESGLKKQRKARLSVIEARLNQLEHLHADSADPVLLKEIISLKLEYNKILSNQVNNMLLKIKQKQFELGDKPDRLLARQLRSIQASRSIHQIRKKDGTLATNPRDINECFKEFYEALYESRTSSDPADLSHFLQSLHLPKLDDADRNALNANITLDEIYEAITSLPSSKVPGPDGFGIEFYKNYSQKLAPLMLRLFNHSIENQEFPQSMYDANISLILKKGKDEMDPASYCPISLLNSDLKIFTRILANRLNKCITKIIHSDQTGFIPGRFSFFNVRRVMNILYSKYDSHLNVAILSVDAEKAFDQIEWNYITSVLQEFDLGESFSLWVKMLYAKPRASVLTNFDRSSQFTLHRGTRQGCPLSPLLFAIAIEPLAVAIRNNPLISSPKIGQLEHHISLYADDIILYLVDPERSIPPLLDLLETFGKFSGYSVNWQKSE